MDKGARPRICGLALVVHLPGLWPTADVMRATRLLPNEAQDDMPRQKRRSRTVPATIERVPVQPTQPSGRRPIAPPAAAIDLRLGRLMLPLRVFLGVTFVYAGLVKLVDPSFLDPTAHGSLVDQLQSFARDSPLAPLITAIAIPFAVPIGLLIALGELAVGAGAITGLAAPLPAWGGFSISALFFLTASWATHPYFYGPDLPYAAGWLTLALVGDGGVFVLRGRRPFGQGLNHDRSQTGEWSRGRRVVLESMVLGGVALAVGALGAGRPSWLTGLIGTSVGPGSTQAVGGHDQTALATNSPPPPSATSVAALATPATKAIATVGAVTAAGFATFVIPVSGDPGVLVQLASGKIVAFDALCTHAGCTVEYVPQDQALECPCHGAVFDPANAGAVLAGPTFQPLTALPITIDRETGEIRLSA